MPTQIVLLSKSEIFNSGLREMLLNFQDMEVIGATQDDSKALQFFDDRPDHVLIHSVLNAADFNAAFMLNLKSHSPHVQIVMICAVMDQDQLKNLIDMGVNVVVSAYCTRKEIELAIHSASQHDLYISHSLGRPILNNQKNIEFPETKFKVHLGPRELEILGLVATGLSSKKIAQKLSIATSTVQVHRKNIMRKLAVKNASDLTRYAIREKIIVF